MLKSFFEVRVIFQFKSKNIVLCMVVFFMEFKSHYYILYFKFMIMSSLLEEKEMATHSSIHAWRIPCTEELVGCSPWGCRESDMTEQLMPTLTLLESLAFLFCKFKRVYCKKWHNYFKRQPDYKSTPGEGNGNPLQYSCLENPMDRGAWWATLVHGVTTSQIRLSNFTSLVLTIVLIKSLYCHHGLSKIQPLHDYDCEHKIQRALFDRNILPSENPTSGEQGYFQLEGG